MSFENLNLIEPILRALKAEGYTTPTPIQEQAIPYILQHRDLLGCAQTGTGKTAAFAIPILQLLFQDKLKHKEQKSIKALILTPTRELAIQISESFTDYGKHTGLKNLFIFGGVSKNPQVDALRRGVDILIATPGRLLDLMNQRYVHLDQIKMLILDEADRMLDMGFVNDVKKVIAKVPANRQTLFFSATMPNEIQSLADSILQKPAKVEVAPVSSTADTIQQSLFYVSKGDKRLLLNHILKDKDIKTALVFTRTKHGADKVVKDLIRAGITAEAIHGNKSQNARQRALTNFKNRTTRVLIATDIAARGIDIDELTHVINYEIPNIPETYVHRIGRTGRAGASGIALTFCDGEEEIDFHKLIAKEIPVELGHPYPLSYEAMTEKMMSKAKNAPKKSGGGGGGSRHGGGTKRPGAGGRPAGHRGGGSGSGNGGGNSRGGSSGMSGASRSSSGRR
jgi:ATP-dependent RNA helicase RhlE